MHWEPTATTAVLQERAAFLSAIRRFFAERAIMEIDTPILSHSVVTAPHLESFEVDVHEKSPKQIRYLQTSPEYGMKRLLAAGCGSIYYLGKAFRKNEVGRWHNPEFTLLEWYRPEWDHVRLAKEVEALFQYLLECPPAKMVTYRDLFEQVVNCDPHHVSLEALQSLCLSHGWISKSLPTLDKDGWLDLVMTQGIEPYLAQSNNPWIVTDFPATQASLAKTRQEGSYEVAERFEFYYQGLELANGYHELQCATTLKQRFETDLLKRQKAGKETLPLDERLLKSMPFFPACAGVAVGVDRLLMLKLKCSHIREVLPFAWEYA